MTSKAEPRAATVPVPEPNLTPDEMVARAIALQPKLRAEQDETERRGVHSPEMQEEFRKAGFLRCLQPLCYGGYEFDVKTLYRVSMELARGCPSTAWCLTLSAGHALMLGSYFSEEAQAEAFGPTGDFSAPAVQAATGTAIPADGGWIVNGKWAYASGAPYATHFFGSVLIPGDPRPRMGIALIPPGKWKMLDDWGAVLGMRGSGSNSVVVENARVPQSYVIQIDMINIDVSNGTPGGRLHGNPMYAGRCMSFFHGELVALMVGLGYAALDEYEQILRTKQTAFPPIQPRYLDPDYQRCLGLALGLMYAAKRNALNAAEMYMEYCKRGFEGGKPFSTEEDLELLASLEHGARLAWEAIEMMFRTSGTSGAKDGERMQRYYRDASMYRGHLSAQYDRVARYLALAHLGLSPTSGK